MKFIQYIKIGWLVCWRHWPGFCLRAGFIEAVLCVGGEALLLTIPYFLFCLSLFGKTQHKLELLGPCLKTRDLLFLSNTTPRVTLLVTLVRTFSDLLRENWIRNGGVFPPSLHGVQRMPFPKCLTWERPLQKQCPLLSYFLELLS